MNSWSALSIEIIKKLENTVNTDNTVKTKNISTGENNNDDGFCHKVSKHVRTEVSKPSNRKELTVLTVLTAFLRERDHKRFSKYYEEFESDSIKMFGPCILFSLSIYL